MSEPNTQRVPAGVREGGQFAHSARTEPDVALESDAPVPLREAVDPEDGLYISDFDHGDTVFGEIVVTRSEDDTFYAEGQVWVGFVESLAPSAERLGLDPDEPEDLARYLDTRERVVVGWLESQYGIDRLAGEDWHAQQLTFGADLPADATTADITTALREKTKAVALYNESDPGTYGCRNMWPALVEHLAEEDRLARETLVPLTWTRKFPGAGQQQTWDAQVPVSLLRDLHDGKITRNDIDQYVCDHGDLTDGPQATQDRAWDEVRFDTPQRGQLAAAYRPIAPFGPSQAGS